MPEAAYRIVRVDEWPDAQGRPFSVFVVRTDGGPTMTTTDPFRASLCQRAIDLHRRAKVAWMERGRQGNRLIAVELEAE